MPDLRKRVNAKDPSGLKATENRRAAETQRDFDAALKRILERVQREGATTPAAVQRIVEDELGAYERETTDKVIKWVQDTSDRAVIRSETLLKAGGVKVQAVLGPREASPEVREILEVSVRTDIRALSADTQQALTRALIDGISAGEGARTLTKRVQEATGMERRRAELIARTETMEAFRQSSSDQHARYGIEEEEWLTARDGRVCNECASLDGKRFKTGRAPRVHGGTNANCRCVLLPVVDDV